jgi:RNase P subunit RPR2
MAQTAASAGQDVALKSEVQADEIEICCDKCGGFIVAVEKPTHRLEHIVVFRLRVNCKRCNRRHWRRITFNPTD